MSNLRKRDPSREEIDARVDAIQAEWSETDRQRRARGRHDADADLWPTWEVPTVAVSLPDRDHD